MQHHSLFASPFLTDRLGSEEGLQQLREIIEARWAEDPEGRKISNIGGWHSDTDMLVWGGEVARALAYKAMTMADAACTDVRSPEKSRFGWVPEMWANISHRGHANQYHFHPGSYLSAVAYIDDGYNGADDHSLGGELQLLDPRMPMIQMTAPDLRLREKSGHIQRAEVTHRPKSGTIVLFPSWLQHAVRPFAGSGTRISVAINLIAAMKYPAAP